MISWNVIASGFVRVAIHFVGVVVIAKPFRAVAIHLFFSGLLRNAFNDGLGFYYFNLRFC